MILPENLNENEDTFDILKRKIIADEFVVFNSCLRLCGSALLVLVLGISFLFFKDIPLYAAATFITMGFFVFLFGCYRIVKNKKTIH
jgi:uncharacterized membrane protein